MSVPLREVLAALDARYHPALAESWDAVGLVCGDPDEPVRRVLFAVDPTTAVVDEVLGTGADLLVTHHPLLLTPVHGVPADDP
ncbi:MAG TPA: Nif3-like dinuclear metal center hexameric protein, partial [Blastococcus sp.]